jgi:photosystem II stability/assembly factor-like uncharacterized protein
MKNIKYLSVICYLLFAICASSSQWVQQVSGTSSNILDVEFINRYTGWTCNHNGEILKTTNGGTNWFQQNSNVQGKILWGIHPVNESIVYCVGWFQTIIKTTNGGNNWTVIRNGPTGIGASFYELYFINQNTGWLLRDNYILRTTNGCASFDSAYTVYTYLMDIYFKDALTGVLCGDGALIMRSTNGGANWTNIIMPIGTEASDFYKISFVGNTGWVVSRTGANWLGGYKVYRTLNFGINWDSLCRIPYPIGTENYCVYFSSESTGWCGGSYGHVYKTTNSGFNWIEENTQSNSSFVRSLWFYNDSIGWGVGGGGKIIHTTNSGMPVAIVQLGNESPEEFVLHQNCPNPFNPSTEIKFSIPYSSIVSLKVYNLLGEEIASLINNEYRNSGKYSIKFDGSNIASGVYFYKLEAGLLTSTKKMVLVK